MSSAAPNCYGQRRLLAFITDPQSITRILAHLGLPTELQAAAKEARPSAVGRVAGGRAAHFDDELTVRARLHVDASARIDFTYRVARAADDVALVLGRTVQVLTTPQGELLLAQPRFVTEFLQRWRDAIVESA